MELVGACALLHTEASGFYGHEDFRFSPKNDTEPRLINHRICSTMMIGLPRLLWCLALGAGSFLLLVPPVIGDASSAPDTTQIASTSDETCKNDDDLLVQSLIEWTKNNEGVLDHRQVVQRSCGNIRNVIATELIPKETVLLSIPWDLMLYVEYESTSQEDDAWCDLVELVQSDLNEFHEDDQDGEELPYMNYLTSLSKQPPSEWKANARAVLGKVWGKDASTSHNEIDKNLKWWEKTCRGKPAIDKTGREAAILSRSYAEKLLDHNQKPFVAMIPMYDLYYPKNNGLASSEKQIQVEFSEEDGVKFVASRDIQVGETIQLSNVPPINIHDMLVETGMVQMYPRRHAFEYVDVEADVTSRTLRVYFDLSAEHTLSWLNKLPPSSRATTYMMADVERLTELSQDNEVNDLPIHEKAIIVEYIAALIDGLNAAINAKHDPWPVTRWTTREYEVAGVNLATYKLIGVEQASASDTREDPFELFEDFDISNLIQGDENWKDLIEYRRTLDRMALRFYVDKVARKRWLPIKGIPQAKQYVLKYASELTETGDRDDEAKALHALIPDDVSFAGKPSHNSEGKGVWLVSHDVETDVTSYTSTSWTRQKAGIEPYDKMKIAESLAESLHIKAREKESLTLQNVKPGVVVEEQYVDFDYLEGSPVELTTFVIWGKVWLSFLIYVKEGGRDVGCRIYRDGTLATASETGDDLEGRLSYIDWPRVVEISEILGANKDMIRIDTLVGLPAGSVAANSTREERLQKLEYIVSESEIYPTTPWKPVRHLSQEGARLWVAGYKIGNYRTVPTTEVPKEFLDTGSLSAVE